MNINEPIAGRGLALPFIKSSNEGLPLARRIPDRLRNEFVAACGEFVGTFLFLFFALSGTQVANTTRSSAGLSVDETGDNPAQLQYIALCFGFSLAINAWVFFRISGGLFNPAVTVGMCLIGALPWLRGALLFATQLLGGMAAAAVVSCLFPGSLEATTTLGGGASVVQGLFIEMFLTTLLVFTIFMLAAEKHRGTYLAPVGIGLAMFVAELTGVYYTGGSLNPARSFGPAVATRSFPDYHWIYWLGPILGSIVAAGFYKFIKALEYETANPGQDNDHEAEVTRRKDLLIAAGINEADAQQVAAELTQEQAAMDKGGVDPRVMSHGQGRLHDNTDPSGFYGTQFSASKEAVDNRMSNASDSTATETIQPIQPTQPQARRPTAQTTGSQIGKYSYLGRAGRRPSGINPTGNSPPHTPTQGSFARTYSSGV